MSLEPPATHWPEATPRPAPHHEVAAPAESRPINAAGTRSAPPIPEGPCPVRPRLAQEFEPWRQAAYYKAMLDRAGAREALLEQERAPLQAKLRLREQQLFGRKTESEAGSETTAKTADARRAPRARGRQPGRPGPKRRDYSPLPAVEHDVDLPADQRCCSDCGCPFAPSPGTDDATVLEIDARARRRIYRRRRYRPTCPCGTHPGIVTPPPPAKVNPKSLLGISVWVTALLDKFLFRHPTYRLPEGLRTQGLDLSQGTITDGLQRLLPCSSRCTRHW